MTRDKKLIQKSKKRTKKRNTMSLTKTTKAKKGSLYGGAGKHPIEDTELPSRKSGRHARLEPMSKSMLGFGFRDVSYEKIRSFVYNEILEKPQIVDVPAYPERHAILVDVQLEHRLIMISDWGGSTNETRGLQRVYINGKEVENEDFDSRFVVYSEFMKLLREKYMLPIEYYSVDEALSDEAFVHHNAYATSKNINGHGGCSYYIYKWAEKYYTNYAI